MTGLGFRQNETFKMTSIPRNERLPSPSYNNNNFYRPDSTYRQDTTLNVYESTHSHSPTTMGSNMSPTRPYNTHSVAPSINSVSDHSRVPLNNLDRRDYASDIRPSITESNVNRPINPNTINEKGANPKKKRSCFCCTRGGALCCGVFTVLLVIGIALAAFFLWPRVPKVEFVSITLPESSTTISDTNFSDLFKGSSNSLKANAQINFKVTNANYIDIVVNGLDVKGSMKAGGGTVNIKDALAGQIKNSVNLHSQATSPFSLPIQLSLPTSEISQLAALGEVCNSKGEITFPYSVTLDLALLSWTGYKPSISDTFSFPCPWSIPTMGL